MILGQYHSTEAGTSLVSAQLADVLRHFGPTAGAPLLYIVVSGESFPGQSSERVSQP